MPIYTLRRSHSAAELPRPLKISKDFPNLTPFPVAPALLRWQLVNLSPQIPVAVFLTSFHPGGTERQMTELVQRLDRGRFEVHVACFHREGSWLSRMESHASVTEFPIQGFARPQTLAQAAAFARWCRARRIAVLQTCDLYANTFALPAATLARVPLRIGSRRELNPDKTAAQIALQRHAYRCAHGVVANSEAAAGQLRLEGISANRIHVIPNGIEIVRYDARRGVRPVTTIVTVANLRSEKAHEVLLHAARRLAARHRALRYLIVGDGPRRTELMALATSLGLNAQVTFVGHRDDVPALLAQADLFVLPSRSEAFPNGAMEAMAAGLPVIASRVGGLVDLIEDGRTGILVSPAEPPQFAAAIEELVLNPERAFALGSAARDEVARRYSFERMVGAFEQLYFTQLAAAGSRAHGRAGAFRNAQGRPEHRRETAA
jgi:glycosyltransferase involved in cell wall biosynthesis